MNNKKIIIFLSFIILILSINSLYAADDNTTDKSLVKQYNQLANTDMLEQTQLSTKHTQLKQASDTVYVNSKSNISTEDGSKDAPYKQINDETIAKISSDSTIIVSSGTYNITPTTIDKNLSIIGEDKENVFFIPTDAAVFTIAENTNVMLENLTITNQSSTYTQAITNNGNLTIENVDFLNNFGTANNTKGTCILNNATLYVNNSNFENITSSYGASIYNTGDVVVNNSKFKRNNISNVGGAIYSMRGNLEVYNSNFLYNAATSGAAIYNAAGYLLVDNTEFYKNDAERFFGGAIYSTGITIVNNSQFYSNHAKKDGGAITNTNNFTITNCYFEQNIAEENGGAIENVPWSTTQNGNLTIINSTFKENSAGENGGAIINYDKEDYLGDGATVTARASIFDSNSASKAGGLIYNQQYMDFQYNVIINNDADVNNTISSDEEQIISIENNWWATNNPTQSKLGAMPKSWVVMGFTNTTSLVENFTTNLTVSLNTLNNGQLLDSQLPSRFVRFTAENTTFTQDIVKIQGDVSDNVVVLDDVLYAQIDNQLLSLDVARINLTATLVNDNNTLQIKLVVPEDISGKTTIKVNSLTIFDKQKVENGSITLEYDIPNQWTKDKYNMTVIFVSDENQSLRFDDVELQIPKRQVDAQLSIVNDTPIKVGSTIGLVATITLNNQTVNSGRVSFKINGLTIQSNVKVTDGQATVNYTIPTSFSKNNYTFSIIYSGDGNKLSSYDEENVKLSKHDVYSNLTNSIKLLSDSNNTISVRLFDEDEQNINVGRACFKVNYLTMQTNITVADGIISFNYKSPQLKNSDEIIQKLTIKYDGTANYNNYEKEVDLIIS